MASSSYFDNPDGPKKKTSMDKLLDGAFALAWITVVGTVTYGVMMFTDVLPPEMRLSALDQMINPEEEEELDPEETVKLGGLDPESIAMMAMAAQTMGETDMGMAATDILEEYDEEAFALMQEMNMKGGTVDYAALLNQLPTDAVDTEMSPEEALATLSDHAVAMAEVQAIMNEAGVYNGPADGLDETGDLESMVADMEDVVGVAYEDAPGETVADDADLGLFMQTALEGSDMMMDTSDTVKSMTDQALGTLLDEQRFTVPMLDTDTMDVDKIKAYKDLLQDPETMLSGETEESVSFIKSYMLPHTLLTDAITYREAGETDRALNALRLIFLAFPEHRMTGDALLLLSDIQDTQGESDASRRSLNTFLSVHGGHPRIVDGVVRFSDWEIASGDGLPSACEWLSHVGAYPPALHQRGLKAIQRAASLRGCYAPPAPAEIAATGPSAS
ncbi:MAG: hypothetical protein AAF253_08670 [Pseudomonadota bacterium]